MPDDNNLPIPNQTAGPVKPVLTTEEIPAAPTAQTPTASTPSTDLNPTATVPTTGFSIPETTDIPPPPAAAAGLPPIIPEAPRKKFGGKRFISTILGLLLLVGGVGAGVVLVRQQQDIREKAAIACPYLTDCNIPGSTSGAISCTLTNGQQTFCCPANNPSYDVGTKKCGTGAGPSDGGTRCGNNLCEPSYGETESTCSKDCRPDVAACGSGLYCSKAGEPAPTGSTACTDPSGLRYCCPAGETIINGACSGSTTGGGGGGGGGSTGGTTPGGGGGGGACTQKPEIWGDYSKFPIDKADCEFAADGQTFKTCYEKYKKLGCQAAPANPQDDLGCAKVGRRLATRYGYPSYECGATAKELGFINCTNALGVYERWCLAAAGPIAQCRDIKAYDTNWTALSATDLSSLKAGDKVRFAVSGTAASGTITKARFIINGTTRPEVTQKKPGTEEFYDEYTIPEGTTSFSVNAQLFHSTEGWF